ncbi:MAG: phage tail family protein [Oscillospiraceae bacterium]
MQYINGGSITTQDGVTYSPRGFIYGGVRSTDFGIVRNADRLSILPTQRQYAVVVPSRDGVIDYGIGGYDTRVINMDLIFEGRDFADLRASRDKIMAWLGNIGGAPKKLIMMDDPNRYYMAKIRLLSILQSGRTGYWVRLHLPAIRRGRLKMKRF